MDMSFDDLVVAFGLDDEATVSPHFVRDEGRGFPTIPFEWSGSYSIKPLQPIRRCNIPVLREFSLMIWVVIVIDVARPKALWTMFNLAMISIWECLQFNYVEHPTTMPRPVQVLGKLASHFHPGYVTSLTDYYQPKGHRKQTRVTPTLVTHIPMLSTC